MEITIKEIRQKIVDWVVEIALITKFEVPAGTWISEGKAAAKGLEYPGGGYQEL